MKLHLSSEHLADDIKFSSNENSDQDKNEGIDKKQGLDEYTSSAYSTLAKLNSNENESKNSDDGGGGNNGEKEHFELDNAVYEYFVRLYDGYRKLKSFSLFYYSRYQKYKQLVDDEDKDNEKLIMVSKFILEACGRLQLSKEEKKNYPNIPTEACCYLKPAKFPGAIAVFTFDNSMNHIAFADDAFILTKRAKNSIQEGLP
ncbi:14272_t:CDS:2 [Cetraspora pellucida]|uniref:14272_t:CDS:1 n=1 Tax=Cetraspora pellucida TaxID=1433469 RepID=A0A9N9CGI9_9GLOM|nr:14272_t:CDS:2 [Cetraspora pellucida]